MEGKDLFDSEEPQITSEDPQADSTVTPGSKISKK
jgi:hypothetical protein